MRLQIIRMTSLALALVCSPLWSQSVADAAAASKANKKSTSKTITNDDVKQAEPSDSQENDADSSAGETADKHENRAVHLRNQVRRLKVQIKSSQARLDQLQQQKAARESRFSNSDTLQREEYSARFRQAEAQLQNAIERTQQQLEQLKTKLSDLQEQARREGFGNSVYEPD